MPPAYITQTLGDVRSKLSSLPDGSKIAVHYRLAGDYDVIAGDYIEGLPRVFRGTLSKSGDSWLVRAGNRAHRVPTPGAFIVNIEVLHIPARPASRSRSEDTLTITPLGHDDVADVAIENVVADRHFPQPPAEPAAAAAAFVDRRLPQQTAENDTMRMVLDLFRQQQETHSQQIAQLTQMVTSASQQRARDDDQRLRREPGNDVSTLLQMSDALRGQDNPTWRLAPGLILPRFISERFFIVSIPHLLFKEDPVTGEMIKVPRGTALPTYKAMLSSCKLQFPNQVAMRFPNPKRDKKDDSSMMTLSAEGNAGVRAQIERAERMFADLLLRLDNLDARDLPTSKQEWMIFIDAGATLLDLYATLANGFLKGGAKVAIAYSNTISSQGKFDPTKLWQNESTQKDSFHH